jgi:hypothetical protein
VSTSVVRKKLGGTQLFCFLAIGTRSLQAMVYSIVAPLLGHHISSSPHRASQRKGIYSSGQQHGLGVPDDGKEKISLKYNVIKGYVTCTGHLCDSVTRILGLNG